MPKISFSFSGWCRADIERATNMETGEEVDVSNMTAALLAHSLEKGELCISLGDHLYSSHKNEIVISDFIEEE